MFFVTVTASVHADANDSKVHVVTNPELSEPVEQLVAEEITRAGEVVSQLETTSPDVIELMRELKEKDFSEYRRGCIEHELRHHYEAALMQGGFPRGMWTPFASMSARRAVRHIRFGAAMAVASIVVYFQCDTVEAQYELHVMGTSGFIPMVFLEIVKSLTRTSVDVYIYITADESGLLTLTFTRNRGLLWDRHLLTLKLK